MAPFSRQLLGSGALTTRGYIGAWVDRVPVVEALDFALGRQYYNFRPFVEAIHQRAGTVIYLGPPQQGWGHFLTQGLSRIWYALEHPEIPVLWDAIELQPYQQHALELIGLRNPQIFLTEPVEWERVIFPYPGLCIGEFALPEFTRKIGQVPPASPTAGKRLFLSRTGLSKELTLLERELDDLVVRHGFTLFRPEEHSISQQLREMSSAEVVLGLEGSALHTPLLLQDPLRTRFFALTRHRSGAGVFEHIRRAKNLRYETLNFLTSAKRGGHRAPLDLDLLALNDALEKTAGFTTNLDSLQDRIEKPWPGQTSFDNHLRMAQVHQTDVEALLTQAHIALSGTPQNAVANMLKEAI